MEIDKGRGSCACACASGTDRGNSRGVVKQPATREKEGKEKNPLRTNNSGSAEASPAHNNYVRLVAFDSSQVSASRSLNGAGYRAAFTDPQHQLQPLRFGESRFHSFRTRAHCRFHLHATQIFKLLKAPRGFVSAVFILIFILIFFIGCCLSPSAFAFVLVRMRQI